MKDQAIVLINSEQTAQISIFDRGFLFGDSVYEVTRSYGKRFLFLHEHLIRMKRSCELLAIDYPEQLLKADLDKLQSLIKDENYYLRIILTRGVDSEINLSPSNTKKTTRILIAYPFKDYPRNWYEQGVSMQISKIKRNPVDSLNPEIKSGNYLNNMLALQLAKQAGYYDAIMFNHQGHLTECTTSNIWFIQDDVVCTPHLSNGLLSGITRAKILDILKLENIAFKEGHFNRNDLKNAQEVFLSSSTKEIVPITKIDQKPVGNGLVGSKTKELMQLYSNHVKKIVLK
jgi:branched-chain amino acid aminotransferase